MPQMYQKYMYKNTYVTKSKFYSMTIWRSDSEWNGIASRISCKVHNVSRLWLFSDNNRSILEKKLEDWSVSRSSVDFSYTISSGYCDLLENRIYDLCITMYRHNCTRRCTFVRLLDLTSRASPLKARQAERFTYQIYLHRCAHGGTPRDTGHHQYRAV